VLINETLEPCIENCTNVEGTVCIESFNVNSHKDIYYVQN